LARTIRVEVRRIGVLVTILAVMICVDTRAQYYNDLGIRLGGSWYLGELSGTGAPQFGPMNIEFGSTGLNFGFHYRHFFSETFAINTAFNFFNISGTDKTSTVDTRYSRNLSFKNNLLELSTRGEVHFLKIRDVGRTFRYRLDFSVFGFGGIGVAYSNPRAEYNGSMVALAPLETEGVSYSQIAPVVPFGVGAQFRINNHHIIGFEVGARMTFTDYLDDVSSNYKHISYWQEKGDPTALALQDRSIELEGTGDPLFVGSEYYSYGSNETETGKRGNPETNDWYMFAGFTYSYALKSKRKSFKRRKYHFVRAKVRRRRSRAKF
jgi:hypothetical protein